MGGREASERIGRRSVTRLASAVRRRLNAGRRALTIDGLRRHATRCLCRAAARSGWACSERRRRGVAAVLERRRWMRRPRLGRERLFRRAHWGWGRHRRRWARSRRRGRRSPRPLALRVFCRSTRLRGRIRVPIPCHGAVLHKPNPGQTQIRPEAKAAENRPIMRQLADLPQRSVLGR